MRNAFLPPRGAFPLRLGYPGPPPIDKTHRPRTAATHVPAHAHVRPSFRSSSRRAAWRTRYARRFRSRLSSLAEGGHVLLGLTEQLAETLLRDDRHSSPRSSSWSERMRPRLVTSFGTRSVASTAAVRLKVFSNVMSRVTCSRIAGSRGSPARKRTWPSRSIVAFTAAFSRAACASQELRTPVVGRVNSLTSISGEKSEEDHATNLIYIEIFKIGVDPLSEAAVVKTKASSAGTREPSARRIDVD